MITNNEVYEAVQRGYTELESASPAEIIDYFSSLEPESITGHISNIKGIFFEQVYLDTLSQQGIDAAVFDATNHPVSDIAIYDDGDIVNELQLKATDSAAYIAATIDEHPELDIVVTSEVASDFSSGEIINSEIENAALEDAVGEAIFDEFVNPVSPFSVISWIFGLPF